MTGARIQGTTTIEPTLRTAPAVHAPLGLLEWIRYLLERSRPIAAGALIAGCLAAGGSYLMQPVYTARSIIMPPQQQSATSMLLSQLGALGGLASAAGGLKNPADQYISILSSASIADRIIDRFDLMRDQEFRDDAYRDLDKATRITSGRDGLIVIEVDDPTPARAADMANAYVQELRALLDRLSMTEAQQRRVFFEKQLNQTHERLIAAQSTLQLTGIDINVAKLEPQRALEAVARLGAQVRAQELRIDAMRGYLSDGSPDIRQAQFELAALRRQLSDLERSTPRVRGGESDYATKYREFKYQEMLFEIFARQFEMAKSDEARDATVIQVIDEAKAPERRARPKRALIAILVTIGAGLLGIFFVVARRLWIVAASASPEAR
jgi:uncharacterized protein involved in exopolysaccharide biosynthesis